MADKKYGRDGSGKVRTASGQKDGVNPSDYSEKPSVANWLTPNWIKAAASKYGPEQAIIRAGEQEGASRREKVAAQMIRDKRKYRP